MEMEMEMEMERGKVVVVSSGMNGGAVMKLPIGFRFHPTDEELVVHYLKRKVNSSPLPASVIPEFDDVAQTNPWDLPGDWKEKRYFFRKRKGEEKYICKRMSSTGCGCGYWKAIGKEKHIVATPLTKEAAPAPAPTVVVGLKKTLLFYQAVGNHPLPTNWVMHQYRLLPPSASQTTPNNSSQRVAMKMEDWVVCCIYEKKRKRKNHDGLKSHRLISNISCNNNVNVTKKMQKRGFMKEDMSSSNDHHPPQPTTSSTCSSGITDLSSNGPHHHHHHQDQEEASSADQLCFSSYISRMGGHHSFET